MYSQFNLVSQQPAQPEDVLGLLDKILNIFYTAYDLLGQMVVFLLQKSEFFMLNPDFADYIGKNVTLLIAILVVLLLTYSKFGRKLLWFIIGIGCILLLASVLVKVW